MHQVRLPKPMSELTDYSERGLPKYGSYFCMCDSDYGLLGIINLICQE